MCISLSFFTVDSTNKSTNMTGDKSTVCHKLVITVWRDVGEGDLHEALQGQEGQTGVDDQPQELTRFT